jgi:hypothetical protein
MLTVVRSALYHSATMPGAQEQSRVPVFCVSGGAMTEAEFDIEALQRDPHYRRFVDVVGEILYEAMERDGTLPERWRRPGSKAREHGTEEAAGHGREAV